jgi:hypothetical protein
MANIQTIDNYIIDRLLPSNQVQRSPRFHYPNNNTDLYKSRSLTLCIIADYPTISSFLGPDNFMNANVSKHP